MELWTEKNPSIADNQVVEATIFTKGPVIRAREASPDIYASIDLVFEKLERQVKKYRGKLVSHGPGHPQGDTRLGGLHAPGGAEDPEEEAPTPRIVKTKQFMIKPMTPEEAALQLELVGHDFYVFTNAEIERDGGRLPPSRRQLRTDRSADLRRVRRRSTPHHNRADEARPMIKVVDKVLRFGEGKKLRQLEEAVAERGGVGERDSAPVR